jgi:hypothetical protein
MAFHLHWADNDNLSRRNGRGFMTNKAINQTLGDFVVVPKDAYSLTREVLNNSRDLTDFFEAVAYKVQRAMQSTQYPISMYDAQPARSSETNWHGGLLALATGQPLNSVPTNIVVTKGTGKLMIVVNAGSDLTGNITITGTSVDRYTGATTAADTDIIPVDSLTTDGTTTDANGNTVHSFTGAYISSKWFTGSVTLSTTDLTLTDVDVYHVSFEQNDDTQHLTITTFDANIFTTNTAAEFDAYLYGLRVTDSKCDLILGADLHVGAVGLTAIANRYWRLKRGDINEDFDGTTDGWWVDVHYSNSPAYVEDVTITAWFTKTQLGI